MSMGSIIAKLESEAHALQDNRTLDHLADIEKLTKVKVKIVNGLITEKEL